MLKAAFMERDERTMGAQACADVMGLPKDKG
jgi:hypothetical protein